MALLNKIPIPKLTGKSTQPPGPAMPRGSPRKPAGSPVKSLALTPATPVTPTNLVRTPEDEEKELISNLFSPVDEGNIFFSLARADDTGKWSTVLIVTPKKQRHRGKKKLPSPELLAIKLQAIKNPKDLSDQAYKELQILETLTQLATQKQCFHFVTLNQWFKAWKNQSQQMNYVLEFADQKTFRSYAKEGIKMTVLKPLIFQICWALYVAHKQLSFVHNDFHFGNILLKSMPKGKRYCHYEDASGDCWYLETNLVVKITDFGLSSLRTSGGVDLVCKKVGSIGLDLAALHLQLKALRILENNDPDWNSFLRQLRTDTCDPLKILHHPFFASFRQRPADFAPVKSLGLQSVRGAIQLKPKI